MVGIPASLPWCHYTTLGIPPLPPSVSGLHVTDLSVHGVGVTAWAQEGRVTMGESLSGTSGSSKV